MCTLCSTTCAQWPAKFWPVGKLSNERNIICSERHGVWRFFAASAKRHVAHKDQKFPSFCSFSSFLQSQTRTKPEPHHVSGRLFLLHTVASKIYLDRKVLSSFVVCSIVLATFTTKLQLSSARILKWHSRRLWAVLWKWTLYFLLSALK